MKLIGVSFLIIVEYKFFRIDSSKVVKHDKSYSNNNINLSYHVSFIFNTFDFSKIEIVDFFHKIQRVMNNNIIYLRLMNSVQCDFHTILINYNS